MIVRRMFHWSPTSTTVQTWMPEEGWNRTWTEKDKIIYKLEKLQEDGNEPKNIKYSVHDSIFSFMM